MAEASWAGRRWGVVYIGVFEENVVTRYSEECVNGANMGVHQRTYVSLPPLAEVSRRVAFN